MKIAPFPARPTASPIPALPLLAAALALLAVGAVPAACRAQAAAPAPAPDIGSLSRASQDLAARVGAAVVQIFITAYGPVETGGGAAVFGKQRGSGSGVILDPTGYIVTNAHVVEGARRIQVLLSPTPEGESQRRSILPGTGHLVGARLMGLDRETDLAVLRIPGEGLPSLTLGDSDELRQGQLVFAFGSPRGLRNSVSLGIVSSVARQLRDEDPMIYIQTDAAINPGNSGGPLVNARGEVVGINTFIFTASGGDEGLGFAAPSNIVRNVYEQIRGTGRVRRGIIGASTQTVTPWLARGLGLGQDWGVVLSDVVPDGPAWRAGLRPGDMVLTLDGKAMENGRQFDVNVYNKPIGGRVRLVALRGQERRTVQVEVIERRDPSAVFRPLVSADHNLVAPLGVLALDLSDEVRAMLPDLREPRGAVVAARTADAPAAEGLLLPGDVIHRLNRDHVADLAALRRLAGALQPGDVAVLSVERAGRLRYVALEVE